MKKPQIRSIIPHFVRCEDSQFLSGRIAGFHVRVIESRLGRLELTLEQKLTMIDKIIANLKYGKVYDANHPD